MDKASERKDMTDYNKIFGEICVNCGCTFGSHCSGDYYSEYYKMHIPNNCCPGHEGRMDWDKGFGTVFKEAKEE